MNKGKEKCKALKEIRRKIAEENDIVLLTQECTYRGECKGTCPKCEAELSYLERELSKKQSLGHFVTVAGLSLMATCTMSSCLEPMDGDVDGRPSYYDSDLPGRENAQREVVMRNMKSYLEDNALWLEDNNWYPNNGVVDFVITTEGSLVDINVWASIKDRKEDISRILRSMPKDILLGLSQDCRYQLEVMVDSNRDRFFFSEFLR